MWEELENNIKIDYKCNVDLDKSKPIMGEGNKKAKFLFLFDHITDEMTKTKSIIQNPEFELLKIIIDFVKIDIKDCYFTSLTKFYNKTIVNDEERMAYMPHLLNEIYLVDPDYIICMGKDIFEFLCNYYIKEKDKVKVDFEKNIGSIFNFYGKGLVPIYEMKMIKKLSTEQKQKFSKILKEINK